MTSASPGLVTAFQPNNFYPTHEAYIEAHRRGDAGGIRGDRIARASRCSSIAPISPWRITPAFRI